MQSYKFFLKNNFLNSLIFFSTLVLNTLNMQESYSKTCKKWINHLQNNGLEVVDNIVEDIIGIKKQYNIPNNLRSCHSAKIGNYTIEGHVPISSINKLLKEKPNISGIAVPGMPHGSPGMETHSHNSQSHNYDSLKVISFSNNGTTKIFDTISL